MTTETRYICDNCGQEFDDSDSALAHEGQHKDIQSKWYWLVPFVAWFMIWKYGSDVYPNLEEPWYKIIPKIIIIIWMFYSPIFAMLYIFSHLIQ